MSRRQVVRLLDQALEILKIIDTFILLDTESNLEEFGKTERLKCSRVTLGIWLINYTAIRETASLRKC